MNRHVLMRIFFWISFTILVCSMVGVVIYNIGGGIINFMMFFTVQTNIAVVLYFAFYRTKTMERLKSTITVLISMTCVIYYLFIFPHAKYVNHLHFIFDGGLHFVNPMLMITSNFVQKNRASYFTNIYVMLYCFGYLAFSFTVGQVMYSFLKIDVLGIYYVVGFIGSVFIIVNLYSIVLVKTNNISYFKFKRRQHKNNKDFKETIKAVREFDREVLQLKGTETKYTHNRT